MISVLILTFNEERNLQRCLESVRWSDDVLVLDSFSTDRTTEIARANGVRVIQRAFDNFASQRNFGLREGGLKHDWVLHLDADEIVTAALREEALAAIHTRNKDAFQVPSQMIFQGRWLKHAGLYPSYQVRLGRRDRLVFAQVGHGQREVIVPEQIGRLNAPLLHYSFSKGLHDWLDKHNRYSSAEAAYFAKHSHTEIVDWKNLISGDPVQRRRALKQLAAHLPCRPLLRFFYMFVLRAGVLDGIAGYHYCRLLAIYEYMIVLKTKEMRRLRQAEAT